MKTMTMIINVKTFSKQVQYSTFILLCFESIKCLVVCIDALHPSQQFSHVGIFSCLPEFNQY